uniref:Uncharacterized protein n=1 Tax=viral metagenome TaxID=1070528 RepID=A0A6M3XSV7_9ZZZZ
MSIEDIENAIKALGTTDIVTCPLHPVGIPGIGAGAEDANDALGTVFTIDVPKRGVLVSATYFDLDDEGTQVNFYLFKSLPTAIADNAAWTCSDADVIKQVTRLAFFVFNDQTVSQTSEIKNIGKAYTAPEGKFYIQAQCAGTPTIATGSAPRLQLQIQSFDPNFKES